MKGVIIIPARLQSSRLPGKLLLDRTGKPLIQHVYDNCMKAVEQSDGLLEGPILATDSKEIIEATSGPRIEGGNGIVSYSMTNAIGYCVTTPGHPNGTSRCAEALKRMGQLLGNEYDFVINVQADEPELSPDAILTLANTFSGTIVTPVVNVRTTDEEWRFNDASVVKVVMGASSRAIYFSRCPVPFDNYGNWYRHVGAYRYQADFLRSWGSGKPAIYEDLEQTGPLFYGIDIQTIEIEPDQAGYAINTASDYEQFVFRYLKEHPECHSHA